MVELRGNVDTGCALEAGDADGLVLAMAGLQRLGRDQVVSFAFDEEQMTPAAGQGCLVVQTRTGARRRSKGSPTPTPDPSDERAAVVGLGADCSSPVGVHARLEAAGW